MPDPLLPPDEVVRRMIGAAAARQAPVREAWLGVRATLPRVADACRQAGALRAWVIGSVAHGGFHAGSDVDIVVEGVPWSRHTELWLAIEQLTGREVDLLHIEELPAAFEERVRTEGEAL